MKGGGGTRDIGSAPRPALVAAVCLALDCASDGSAEKMILFLE